MSDRNFSRNLKNADPHHSKDRDCVKTRSCGIGLRHRATPTRRLSYVLLPHGLIPNLPLEETTVTLRITLTGALASIMLLVGLSSPAVAQDNSDTADTDTPSQTESDTETSDTTTDTSQTDTTTDTETSDTTTDTTTDTSQTDTTTDTETSDTTTDTSQTEAADTTATTSPSVSGDSGQGDDDIAAAFADGTPNPQPSAPLTPATDAEASTAAADEVLGEVQLAFTGPDTRVAALAAALLTAGATCVGASRRRTKHFSDE